MSTPSFTSAAISTLRANQPQHPSAAHAPRHTYSSSYARDYADIANYAEYIKQQAESSEEEKRRGEEMIETERRRRREEEREEEARRASSTTSARNREKMHAPWAQDQYEGGNERRNREVPNGRREEYASSRPSSASTTHSTSAHYSNPNRYTTSTRDAYTQPDSSRIDPHLPLPPSKVYSTQPTPRSPARSSRGDDRRDERATSRDVPQLPLGRAAPKSAFSQPAESERYREYSPEPSYESERKYGGGYESNARRPDYESRPTRGDETSRRPSSRYIDEYDDDAEDQISRPISNLNVRDHRAPATNRQEYDDEDEDDDDDGEEEYEQENRERRLQQASERQACRNEEQERYREEIREDIRRQDERQREQERAQHSIPRPTAQQDQRSREFDRNAMARARLYEEYGGEPPIEDVRRLAYERDHEPLARPSQAQQNSSSTSSSTAVISRPTSSSVSYTPLSITHAAGRSTGLSAADMRDRKHQLILGGNEASIGPTDLQGRPIRSQSARREYDAYVSHANAQSSRKKTGPVAFEPDAAGQRTNRAGAKYGHLESGFQIGHEPSQQVRKVQPSQQQQQSSARNPILQNSTSYEPRPTGRAMVGSTGSTPRPSSSSQLTRDTVVPPRSSAHPHPSQESDREYSYRYGRTDLIPTTRRGGDNHPIPDRGVRHIHSTAETDSNYYGHSNIFGNLPMNARENPAEKPRGYRAVAESERTTTIGSDPLSERNLTYDNPPESYWDRRAREEEERERHDAERIESSSRQASARVGGTSARQDPSDFEMWQRIDAGRARVPENATESERTRLFTAPPITQYQQPKQLTPEQQAERDAYERELRRLHNEQSDTQIRTAIHRMKAQGSKLW